jgi:hypothetical protein
MSRVWTPCDFETFKDSELQSEFAALSRIGCAALNCIEVDPIKDSFLAFNKLVSLFCIVSENVSAIAETEEVLGVETDQLSQTVIALEVLKEFPQASFFEEEILESRIALYSDAAEKIYSGLSADGNPIVEIL